VAGNPVPYTLPIPCFNVINGGEHAGNKLPFQVRRRDVFRAFVVSLVELVES